MNLNGPFFGYRILMDIAIAAGLNDLHEVLP